jgi:hypothetical protein
VNGDSGSAEQRYLCTSLQAVERYCFRTTTAVYPPFTLSIAFITAILARRAPLEYLMGSCGGWVQG